MVMLTFYGVAEQWLKWLWQLQAVMQAMIAAGFSAKDSIKNNMDNAVGKSLSLRRYD